MELRLANVRLTSREKLSYHPTSTVGEKSNRKAADREQLKALRRLGRQYHVQGKKDIYICLYMDIGLDKQFFIKQTNFL